MRSRSRMVIHWMTVALGTVALAAQSWAAVEVKAKPAPNFELKDMQGVSHKLEDYKGKFVVLEWFNKDCPFVQKHYDEKFKNMQTLQSTYPKDKVVWLTIASGKSSDFSKEKDLAEFKKLRGDASSLVLLDPKNKVADAYNAQRTPHMFVINPASKIVYSGAIDDKSTADVDDVKGAKNYVQEVLKNGLAKSTDIYTSEPPYGCNIKR